jgi:hypothetical protein
MITFKPHKSSPELVMAQVTAQYRSFRDKAGALAVAQNRYEDPYPARQLSQPPDVVDARVILNDQLNQNERYLNSHLDTVIAQAAAMACAEGVEVSL